MTASPPSPATSSPHTILITGASGAIGSALAREYAQRNVRLILQGRQVAVLQALKAECEALGAHVTTATIDLRDQQALRIWANDCFSQHTVDLLILNAGLNANTGADFEGERWEDIEALLDVNLYAALYLANAALPSMRTRGNGQIAFISSLAAWFGLPMTPTYCASKAALKAYGEGLRAALAPQGIKVNVVMPGYVDSAMCRAMPGPKLLVWPPEKAARVIAYGLQRNQPRITFPFPLNLGTWLLAVMPPALSARILSWLHYRG